MIKTNPISSKETLHYKNIIYQGNTTNHKIMNGSGILYFLTDKNLIISEDIYNNHINGPSIFIYGRLLITMAFGKMINPMEYAILKLTMF
jgi:hypothetical protein